MNCKAGRSETSMTSRYLHKLLILFVILSATTLAAAQQLTFLGNTNLYNTGIGQMPTLGGFIEPNQTLSITTQTYPISPGQSVFLIYTTNDWRSTQTVQLSFDHNVGNNTQWDTTLGPLPANSDILFYLRAQCTNGVTLYDNNSGQNFGFISRLDPQPLKRAIIQWFATPYSTIIQELPIVANLGYGTLYLPPPQKSGGGTYSVGYNPFDRFDLGDRDQAGSVETQYGSTEQFQQLIQLAHRFGLKVIVDAVLNHNDDRASTNIANYPNLLPEDFHIYSTADPQNSQIDFSNNDPFTLNMMNGDLSGLADLAHEDGNLTETGPYNLPNFATFNSYGKPTFIRQPLDPQLYPNFLPTSEDIRQYLCRWCTWLVGSLGIDGLRLDAVREIDPGFFNTVNTQGGFQVHDGDILPKLYQINPNLYIFGEDDNSDSYELREYLKTGMNLLDFPLFNTIGNIFNSNGYGNLGQALTNQYGIDPSTSTPYEAGGLGTDVGVSFVQSHDYGPPTSNNLAYAFILTRSGTSIVYYDGNNLDPNNYSQFPKPGRFDAIGNEDNIITTLVDARARFGRGTMVERYSSSNLDIYDREVNGVSIMLVGLNNRGDLLPLSATVQTNFPSGTILRDLTNQEPDVIVSGSKSVTITVPPNSNDQNYNNAEGYVVYVPETPSLTSPITVTNSINHQILSPTSISLPGGTYGSSISYQEYTLNNPGLTLSVQTDIGATCLVKVDNGIQLPGTQIESNTPEGLADGFIPMSQVGTGAFSISNLDLSPLPNGLHLFRIRVFRNTGSNPGLYSDFCIFVDLNRPFLNVINGDLSKYGSPLVSQTLAPSSQSNRLDEMFVSNDDQYLYLGLAGQVSGGQYTNGAVTMIDLEPGSTDGYSNFNAIKDDYGPAGRLLSNSAITAPPGFYASVAIASFQGDTLNGAPGAPIAGDTALPANFGATEGAFLLSPSQPQREFGIPSKIAWQPRSSPFGPQTGMEVAVPLTSLFNDGRVPQSTIELLSYITTTGETGTTLNAYDPNRAFDGGRPQPHGFVLNQFLPDQNGITNDPGTSPVSLSQFATYHLKFATTNRLLVAKGLSPQYIGNHIYRQLIYVINYSPNPIQGPFFVSFNFNGQASLINPSGDDLQSPGNQYIKLSAQSLTHRQGTKFYVEFTSNINHQPQESFTVLAGNGIP